MNYDFEIKHIRAILDQMNAMHPLPAHGTPEALADHEGWMKRHDEITELKREAEQYALCALPSEVGKALSQVSARMRTLLNLDPPLNEEKPNA